MRGVDNSFIVDMPGEPVYVCGDEIRLTQVVANLLNNAAKYTDRGGRVWLTADDQNVLMQAWDGSGGQPQRRDAGPEAEGGRGLMLVAAFSAEWGSYAPAGWPGKVVWARLGMSGGSSGKD